MTDQIDWSEIRRTRFADEQTPTDWPPDVKPISMNGLTLFGVCKDNNLHWDGKRIKTEVRLGFFGSLVAAAVATSTVVAAVGTASMAYMDWMRYRSEIVKGEIVLQSVGRSPPSSLYLYVQK